MSQRNFLIQLFTITVVFVILAIICGQLAVLSPYVNILWLSILFFVLVSVAMYFFAKMAAKSKNKYAFTNVNIGFTAGKLLLSTILILVYHQLAAPKDNFFIVPFFVVYLVYTAFETNFMLKLSRSSSNQQQNAE